MGVQEISIGENRVPVVTLKIGCHWLHCAIRGIGIKQAVEPQTIAYEWHNVTTGTKGSPEARNGADANAATT
jgi:hypothetical protein